MSTFNQVGAKFGRGKRERVQTVDPLGPGAYNTQHSDFDQKKGYSIAGRHTVHGDDERPGPGQYNYGKFLDKRDWGHGFKMPQAAKKDQRIGTDIGPGGYDIKDKFEGGYSFGKSGKQHDYDSAVPGPGQYPVKQLSPIKPGPKFSKQKRTVGAPLAGEGLGPGAYDIKDKFSGGFRFGRDARDHSKEDGIPGPGNYKEKKIEPLSNLGSFGRQQRRVGTLTIGGTVVGPGNYNPQVDNWCGGYSMGKEKRKGLASDKGTPGAGAYTLKDEYGRGGYSFKRTQKDPKPETTPGYYRPIYTVPDVPKYLLPPEPQRKIHL